MGTKNDNVEALLQASSTAEDNGKFINLKNALIPFRETLEEIKNVTRTHKVEGADEAAKTGILDMLPVIGTIRNKFKANEFAEDAGEQIGQEALNITQKNGGDIRAALNEVKETYNLDDHPMHNKILEAANKAIDDNIRDNSQTVASVASQTPTGMQNQPITLNK